MNAPLGAMAASAVSVRVDLPAPGCIPRDTEATRGMQPHTHRDTQPAKKQNT
jgi:hypothetical protein